MFWLCRQGMKLKRPVLIYSWAFCDYIDKKMCACLLYTEALWKQVPRPAPRHIVALFVSNPVRAVETRCEEFLKCKCCFRIFRLSPNFQILFKKALNYLSQANPAVCWSFLTNTAIICRNLSAFHLPVAKPGNGDQTQASSWMRDTRGSEIDSHIAEKDFLQKAILKI